MLAACHPASAPPPPTPPPPTAPPPTTPPPTISHVAAPDGVDIFVEERGPHDAPAIVFIHGLGFDHQVWHRQLESPLARTYHLVAYDLRGHGRSSRPTDPAAYEDGARWGADLRAVIAATKARNPIVVGWSLGGIPIMEYAHSGGALGGAVFVDAVTKFAVEMFGPENPALIGGLMNPDDAERARATRAFALACFARPVPELDHLLAAAGTLPVFEYTAIQHIRLSDPDATLRSLRVPTLVVFGKQERLVTEAMARYTAAAVPGAELSLYEGSGHAPFLDETSRFDDELVRFAARANRPQ